MAGVKAAMNRTTVRITMRLPARVQQAIDAGKWPDRSDFDSFDQAARWLKTREAKQLESRIAFASARRATAKVQR